MKKIVFTLMYLCFLSLTIVAQDLNPGQQSQGLLESRNVTVDHCTGIFHYNIPLYTLKSGDYELPINLRYTGKGVKENDNPGLVGYNWTLDTGGVVTRTVRGGIPDESSLRGYLYFENDTIPLSEDATRVNRHKRDGECDIFTAVFNGKSVNFIIRKEEGNYFTLYAEPLERTDVRIECVHSNNLINGWVVTDNDGTRYTYMRKEWTTDLNKQDEISFNGLSNLEYVSSWHLTEIEPVNSKVIRFEYSNNDKIRYYNDEYKTKYEYGRAIVEPDYRFDTYKNDFNYYIEEAKQNLTLESERIQMEYNLYLMNKEIQWSNKLEYLDLVIEKNEKDTITTDTLGIYNDMTMEYLMKDEISSHMEAMLAMNHRVLGMVGNFSSLYTSVGILMEQLENLIESYSFSPSVSANFMAARNILKNYLLGTNKKYNGSRITDGIYSYRIKTPVLTSIRSEEGILFEYNPNKEHLTAIIKESMNGNTISSQLLAYSNGKLASLSLMDKDSVNVETTGMEYYTLPQEMQSMADIYGYRKPYSSDLGAPFQSDLDERYARIHSLKEIRQADGGKICLEYELNGFPNVTEDIPFGGIRIKSIVLDNPSEGRKDTINYHYDLALHTYLEMPDNYVEEEYTGFTDKVWHSKIKATGHATLSPGNNGIYYPQVREQVSGQGTRTFFFNFTDYNPDWSHSHWLIGLPVYIIEQDLNGNMVRIQQNLYYTDADNGLALCMFPESLIHSEKALYNGVLPQMVANEKYMDRNAMENHYAEQTGFYLDGTLINPHWEYYENNILPRIQYDYRNICYPLHYGGATVLAEQREYRPQEREYTDHWELMSREQPCSRTVYHYDNLDKHTRPTRIVNYDSRGDSTIVHQVYAGDMAATASQDMTTMKEANILSPVIKRATVKNGMLVEEEVTVYETVAKEDGCFHAPEKILVRKGGNGSYIPDTLSLYAGSMADYQERKGMTSAVIGGDSYLPIGMTEQGVHTAFIHDPNSKWCILQTKDLPADKVIAVDGRHYMQTTFTNDTDTMGRILYLAEKLQNGINNYDPGSIQLDNYQEFRMTLFYERGKRLLELLGKGTESFWTETEITETLTLLDTCAVNMYMGMDEYIAWQISLENTYFPAMGIDSPWNMTYEEMYELQVTLMGELIDNGAMNIKDYLQDCNVNETDALEFIPQTLAVLSGQHEYKLCLISMKEQALVIYNVTHYGGTEEKVLELSGLTPGVLQQVSIDLSGYTHVTGITVTGFGAVQYLALVPEGTEFEATSYNEDGSISIKFDHNGKMRYHEYDSAGRLIRVRDENGKTLEENDYHVKNTTL